MFIPFGFSISGVWPHSIDLNGDHFSCYLVSLASFFYTATFTLNRHNLCHGLKSVHWESHCYVCADGFSDYRSDDDVNCIPIGQVFRRDIRYQQT
jgi:hypothetical protein